MVAQVHGFVLFGIFPLLYHSLPGASGLTRSVSFALLAWFFRIVMSAASQWVIFNVPAQALPYSAGAGLGESRILGMLYGLTPKPAL